VRVARPCVRWLRLTGHGLTASWAAAFLCVRSQKKERKHEEETNGSVCRRGCESAQHAAMRGIPQRQRVVRLRPHAGRQAAGHSLPDVGPELPQIREERIGCVGVTSIAEVCGGVVMPRKQPNPRRQPGDSLAREIVQARYATRQGAPETQPVPQQPPAPHHEAMCDFIVFGRSCTCKRKGK